MDTINFEIRIYLIQRITNDISDIYEIFFKFVSKKNNFDAKPKETGKIKRFACGGSFTLAITDTGLLYAWGYGDHVSKLLNLF